MIDVQNPSETASGAPGSAEAAAAPAAGESWACPECTYVGRNEVGLKIHFRRQHKGVAEPQWTERPRKLEVETPPADPGQAAESGPASPRTPGELEGIRKKTVESLQTLGGLCFVVGLQVTGIALDNRAERLSWQAITYAQRSERFLGVLQAFNEVMATGELAKLGSELGMAVGVDLGVLHPAKPVRFGRVNVPGFVFLKPLERELTQVGQLRQVAHDMQQQYEREMAAAQAAQNGTRPQDAAAGQ